MCANTLDSTPTQDSRQPTSDDHRAARRRQIGEAIRERLGLTPDEVSAEDVYRLCYTLWWMTLVDGRDPDNQDELARTLRMLRLRDESEVAA